VKITKTPKTAIAKHKAEYAKVDKEWEKTIELGDGKQKIVQYRRLKNGVVKSSLKAMYKKGKRIA
jgi:hypothetical protein